jgi:hypothetical protein
MDEVMFKLTVFLIMMVAGALGVKQLVIWLRKQIEVPSISNIPEIQSGWNDLISREDKGGQWIGHIERLALFAVMFFAPSDAPAAVGVWLAFKVAAKWEAWHHMGHIPDEIKDVDPLRLAFARRIWAAQGYATFVVGTSVSVLLAVGGAALARYGGAWFWC